MKGFLEPKNSKDEKKNKLELGLKLFESKIFENRILKACMKI